MMRNKDLTEPEYAEVRTIEKNAAAPQPLIAKTGSAVQPLSLSLPRQA